MRSSSSFTKIMFFFPVFINCILCTGLVVLVVLCSETSAFLMSVFANIPNSDQHQTKTFMQGEDIKGGGSQKNPI